MSIIGKPAGRHSIDVSDLNAEQLRVVREAKWYLAGYMLISVLSYTILDLFAPESDGIYLVLNLVTWFLGYVLFVAAMRSAGNFDDRSRSGIGTYFALGIAIGIPVVFGMIVFVLPGLYLLMRWLPAYARAATTDDGIGSAMRWSWDSTEAVQLPLALGLIGPILCYASAFGLLAAYDYGYEFFDWTGYAVAAVFWNTALPLGMAWLTILGVAVFGLIIRQPKRDVDVFE